MGDENDTFWEDYSFPYNDQDDGFEFVNLVEVAEEFVRMVSTTARLGHQLETLTQERATLEVTKQRAERSLNTIRRSILASGLQDIAKSAKPQILEAFILERAKQNPTQYQEMTDLEGKVEQAQRRLEVIEPRINQVQARLSYMKQKGEMMRQYLDYQKLQIRVEGNSL